MQRLYLLTEPEHAMESAYLDHLTVTSPRHDPSLNTLAELFEWRTRHAPEHLAYTVVRDDLTNTDKLTYRELESQVRSLAASIAQQARAGDRALLMYGPGLDVIRAFWACLLAGIVPVPAPSPDAARLKNALPRLRTIAEDARISIVLTTSQIRDAASNLSVGSDALPGHWIVTDGRRDKVDDFRAVTALPSGLAYLQYTSGSTSAPRGVMITHANVLANCTGTTNAFNPDHESRALSWLPYFHDYGLVHGIIWPFAIGIPAYLMSPVTFLRRPLRWLEAVDRFGITHSGAPNFAYATCAQAVARAKNWQCNLGSLRVASCGAEPINPITVERFITAVRPYGFSANAFTPGYGLAEATLVATAKPYGAEPTSLKISSDALESGRVEEATSTDAGARTLISCGIPFLDTEVLVVDSKSGTRLGPDRVGEVWLAGPSVGAGYWRKPELTQATFKQTLFGCAYLRTGDLGFISGGELYITGRLKDLLIIHGRNHYPQDIEWTVERAADCLRAGYGAAFSIDGEYGEQLVVVQEIEHRTQTAELDAAVVAIRKAVALEHELPIYAVVLIQSGSIPRTSSGKIRRQSCRQDFLENRLSVIRVNMLPEVEHLHPHSKNTLADFHELNNNKDRQSLLERFVATEVARITHHVQQDLPLDASPIECGLDSLSTFRLLHTIESTLGISLPPSSVLGTKSLRTIAAELFASIESNTPDSGTASASEVNQPAIALGPTKLAGTLTDEHIPLSAPQEGVWFVEGLVGSSSLYNLAQAVHFRGCLDIQALERSVQALVARHASLRTSFSEDAGIATQVVHPELQVTLPLESINGSTSELRDQALQLRLQESARKPFDLTQAPLLRAQLMRLSEDEHVLLLVLHHIVADGWSMSVLARELNTVYAAFTADAPAPLEPLRTQYTDYTYWQRDRLKGPARYKQLDYWRERLRELQPLDLPTDRPRPAQRSYRGSIERFEIRAELLAELKLLARQENATLFMVLLTAFKILMMRYTGQEDVAIGSPLSGRLHSEFEDLIGFFTNTLVLRTDLSGNPPCRELLTRVRQTAVDAYTHQEIPSDKLVTELGLERDLSRNSLYQVAFALQNLPDTTLRLGELQATNIPLHTGTAKLDLWLSLTERNGVLEGELEYSSDLFDAATMQRLAVHLQILLAAIVADPEKRLSELSLLDDAERQRILFAWNDTDRAYSPHKCMHQLFEEQVSRSLDAPAAILDNTQLTYRDLNCRANQLAHRLRELGVGPDVLVGVCMERSLELVVSLIAILKAGGAYVPLDPEYPIDRLTFMQQDSRMSVVLTQEGSRLNSPVKSFHSTAHIEYLDTEWRALADYPRSNPDLRYSQDDIAYVIYTSGSTGRPKGVLIPHRGLLNHTCWLVDVLRLTPSDRVLQKTSISFDASVWEFLAPLQVGASVVLAQPGAQRDTPLLLRTAREQEISILQVVPSALRALLDDPSLSDCHALRYVVCGGEALDRELAQDVCRQLPWVKLGNFYGPSEASDDATYFELRASPRGTGTVPIGRPIANARCYVLNAHRQPVPIGVFGELYIGGAGLARGYLNLPELTAERFISDPFQPGDRMYRTGDVARYLPDGNLEYIGRIDHQVKIRGFRIEPGEIEMALNACAGVKQSIVMAREDQPGFKRLVAYVAGDNLNSEKLKSLLSSALPDYMIPATIVLIARLPLLPNGKLDRTALPAPNDEVAEAGYTNPRGPIEQALLEIWREVLKRRTIGVHQNFFELGGHSLLATQVISRVRQTLEAELPLRTLFESPTIAAMAQSVERLRIEQAGLVADPPIEVLSRELALPVSFSQRRMWFIQQLEPQGTAYNMPFALRLKGLLNQRALAAALDNIVSRHEAFRTTFSVVDGEPVQLIAPSASTIMRNIDLRYLPEQERAAEAARILREESMRPFDLARAPLFRFLLIQLGDSDHVIMWLIHHVVGDQWSAGIMSRELAILYRAFACGDTPSLKPLPIQYADFAAWQRRYLGGGALDGQLAYWREKLKGLAVLALPTDRPRPAQQTYRGSHVVATIPTATLASLKRMSARHGATPFMTLLTCFKLLLARYSGQDDIAVGTPIANRTRVATEDLIGTLVNTLVMRSDFGGDPTFSESLTRVRHTALDAYAHQDLPFERLVEELGRARDASHSPLVQVLFNVPNAPMGDLELDGLEFEIFNFDHGSSQFDLSITVETEIFGHVYLTYSTDLFEAATAQRMLAYYVRLIEQVVEDPEKPISAYKITTDAEQRLIVHDWNQTHKAYPTEQRTDQLIAIQAQRTPHAVAVSMGARVLTYAELDARANQLAHYLRRCGVGPEVLVGICLERSPEIIIALLAVMKAGGAYVPLDPAFPRDRLRFMAHDAGLSLILTHSNLLPLLAELSVEMIALDRLSEDIANESQDSPECEKAPASLAYLLFTSGSTGQPKGVEIIHSALTNFLCAMRVAPGCSADDTMLSVTTLSFDIAALELLLPLIVGGRVELASRQEVDDGRLLIERIKQSRPTVMQATPATWRMLIESGWTGNNKMKVLCGGEALPHDLANKLLDRSKALWNMYGPTETTIWSTVEPIKRGVSEISIGRPIANTVVYILDKTLQPVPIGVPGELFIGGQGIARGYRNRADLTAERFIPNPFSNAQNERIYRTGDLARFLPDGRIVHLGRLDFQVKIRGFRIELGEVEAILGRHPGIAQAVIAAKEDRGGLRQLVAYAVLRDHQQLTPVELRAFMRATLPEYMVPSHFLFLDAFPLTANNKINVKALPQPADDLTFATEPRTEPHGDMEVRLLLLWRQVLGNDTLGIHDNFFDRGGHSLKAVQLLSLIEQIYGGKQLPLATLFQAPTVIQMTVLLAKSNWKAAWRSLVAIQPVGTTSPFFAVPGVGGNVLVFAKLSKLLGDNQPFYGLQAQGLDGSREPFISVCEMAAHYVSEIRSVRPTGPYFIGGTCTGGVIAYEMAQQLVAHGEEVTLVIMEAWHPSSARASWWSVIKHGRTTYVWSKLVAYVRALSAMPVSEWPAFFKSKTRVVSALLDKGVEETLANSTFYEEKVARATWQAVANYAVKAYPGRLLNIVALNRHIHEDADDTRRVWETLAVGGSQSAAIAAEDSGRLFVSPHVEELAREIESYTARELMSDSSNEQRSEIARQKMPLASQLAKSQ